MYLKSNYISAVMKLGVCAVLALGFLSEAKAADKADGTWTWTMQGRNGGAERKMSLKLKTEGSKLTGKFISPGRDGATSETEIQDGTVKGDEIAFKVVREFNGNKMTTKYTGKVTADVIKGKAESERNGQAQSRDWEAKREAAKK
jgi:hypothetical protein